MSDSMKANEMNEQELKQVAGGDRGDLKNLTIHYRCLACGSEEWVTADLSPAGSTRPVCQACLKNGRNVKMTEIR